MPDPIPVSINDFATQEELEGVEEAFRSVGIDAEVKATFGMKSADAVPWIVFIPLAVAAGAFFRGYFGKLGADAASRTQQWVRQLRKARESSSALPGTVVIEDANRNTVVLGDPPLEAYEKLFELDFDAAEGAYFVWDDERGEWKDGMAR